MKYLIMGVVIYFIYRFFLAPKKIAPGDTYDQIEDNNEDDGDYVDYEEVE